MVTNDPNYPPLDQILNPPTQPSDPVTGPAPGTNATIGPAPQTLPTLPNPGDVFATIEGGANGVLELFSAVSRVIPYLGAAISGDIPAPIETILGHVSKFLGHIGWVFDNEQVLSWNRLSDVLPTSYLFKEMLQLGLGLHPDDWDAESKDGVKVVDTMLAFAFIVPMVAAAVESVGKPLLANRWASGINESLRKLPEEMGLSWALGLQLDEAFKTAVGRSIEEAINKEKRPNRIDWPVLRTLLRQHVLTPEQLNNLLELNGFPDEQIAWINKLADASLPVGDIQQAYLYNLYDEKQTLAAIKKLGFNDDDSDTIQTLYIDKADTAAANVLRATARQLFRDFLITEAHYRQLLTDNNFPPREIDKDVESIILEQKVGRVNGTVSVIKSRRLHNVIDDGEAITKLQQLGQSLEAATELVSSWQAAPIHPRHGLSQAKILSYLISGILTPEQATAQLLDTGLNPDAISLLIAHPNAHPQVTVHRLTPSFVITAYLDGAIDETMLVPEFTKAGVPHVDIQKWVDIAHFRYLHRKTTPGGKIGLTKGEIVDAFKYSIIDQNQAQMGLEALDIDSVAATIILEIANHGAFQPPTAPYFTNVDDALLYLVENGFKIGMPIDPRISAAEAMLSAAGYTYEPPPGFGGIVTTGPPPTPVGGPGAP